MRTVHETEALRPSDPVPKSMQIGGGGGATGPGGKGSSKLKIIIKTPQSHAAGHDDAVDDGGGGGAGGSADDVSDFFTPLTEEHGFSREELAMPLERLHGLCRWQARWAELDGEDLRRECRIWEDLYKKAWLEKQVLLDQVVQTEMDWHERRTAVLSGTADVQLAAPEVIVDGPAASPPIATATNTAMVANGASA